MNTAVTEIPADAVRFHPASFADPSGRVFWWGGQLYRGIAGERKDFCKGLFDKGIVKDLAAKGLLVETELTNLTTQGYELVLRHQYVPFASFAFEWCGQMLKDAALVVVDLGIELAKHGLALQDGHPYNVLFDGPRPVYIDFGSIIPADSEHPWPPYEEFCRFCLYPLYLTAHGHGRIARWLLCDHWQGVLLSDLAALRSGIPLRLRVASWKARSIAWAKQRFSGRFQYRVKKAIRLAKSALPKADVTNQSRVAFLQGIRRKVEKIRLPRVKTDWSEYYEGHFPSFSPSEQWTAKHHSAHKVLSERCRGSVLDVGTNRGWYAQLAASLGRQVVAFDVDEPAVMKLYQDARGKNLPILPLLMDVRIPSPGYGLRNQMLPAATERLSCDTVMALALVHHLVFKQSLRFEQIVSALSVFSKRWLFVEFIPREDRYVREWWTEKYSWYTLDNFIQVLRSEYDRVEVFPSAPEPRVCLLCERSTPA